VSYAEKVLTVAVAVIVMYYSHMHYDYYKNLLIYS